MGSRNCRSAKQKVEKEKHREKEQPQRRRWVKTITICYENVLSFAFWFFRLNSHFLRIVVLLVCDLDTQHSLPKKNIYSISVFVLHVMKLFSGFVFRLCIRAELIQWEWSSELHDLLNWFNSKTFSLYFVFISCFRFFMFIWSCFVFDALDGPPRSHQIKAVCTCFILTLIIYARRNLARTKYSNFWAV